MIMKNIYNNYELNIIDIIFTFHPDSGVLQYVSLNR